MASDFLCLSIPILQSQPDIIESERRYNAESPQVLGAPEGCIPV